MAVTDFADIKAVNNLVQKFWAPVFAKELRESTLWMNFLKYHYEFAPNARGEMVPVRGGDTLYVSTLNKPTSTVKTIGTDADSFDSNKLSTSQTTLLVNKRAVSSYEFEDLAVLMSQLEAEDSEIRAAMLSDIKEQVNDYIKSIINPSASAPDHVVSGVTDFTFAQLAAIRTLAATAKWNSANEPWHLVADPSYISDLIDETNNSSNDYNGGDTPVVNGAFRSPRLGFNIFEDNSLTTDVAYAFIPSWAIGAFGVPQFKISDLHSNKRFGYVMSVDQVFGAVQHSNTRIIKIYNS